MSRFYGPRSIGRRQDGNDAKLAEYARTLGFKMVRVGEPFDYLAGISGLWVPTEIKNLDGRAGARGAGELLTKPQQKLQELVAVGLPFWIWYTEEDIQRCYKAVMVNGRDGALQGQEAIARDTARGVNGAGSARTDG